MLGCESALTGCSRDEWRGWPPTINGYDVERERRRREGLMFAAVQNAGNTQHLWMIAAGLGVAFLVVTMLVVFLVRRSFRNRREGQREESATSAPRTANPSAFMTASMQGVIQQLREQEKELERLDRIQKERAEQTERLSEEVTRNMPAGVPGGQAPRNMSSHDPCAEAALRHRPVGPSPCNETPGGTPRMAQQRS